LYFVNAGVDVLCLGGASILVYGAVALLHSGQRTEWVIALGYWLAWVFNWPHFAATNYRLYRSWDNIQRYPLTALVVPVLMVGAVIASFAYPLVVAPAFVKLFLVWSPYHFSGQTIGITLLYARRAGVAVERFERLVLVWFIYGTFLLNVVRAEVVQTTNTFHAVAYPTLGLPAISGQLVGWWVIATAVLFALVYLRWCRRAKRLVPPILLLPGVAQFVWFVPGGSVASFAEFVPLFHSLQYLLIAWAMQLKERLDENSIEPSQRFLVTETGRWGALNLLGGIGLFWVLPHVAAPQVGLALATGVIIAGVQIHHFFVDGVIWKLRNPRVSSPLLVHVGDLVGTRQAA
jgi:hypothetical protein